MDGALVALVGIPLDQLELVIRVGKLYEVQDLAKVLESDESSLLTKDVEDTHQIKALLLHMAVDLAQQVLVVMEIVRRLAIELDFILSLCLRSVFKENLDKLRIVHCAIG